MIVRDFVMKNGPWGFELLLTLAGRTYGVRSPDLRGLWTHDGPGPWWRRIWFVDGSGRWVWVGPVCFMYGEPEE